ncbi:molybdopterin-dependent oxidoreductase [Paenibacillus sp. BR2-3]|uniref:molybdopterin-dependent oxidoreductase n=1 Tax=Paenibacillus sp. BR2-3 TaxID=3048494 RepID=UPI003977D3E2
MKKGLALIREGYGKKLVSIHAWNAWLVLFLALSGLLLLGGYWREVLGESRVWLKWSHIVVGLVLLIPVIYYLLLAAKHWKRLKGRSTQKANVIFVLTLLIGWIISGIVLWQFRLAGPRAANTALFIHDLLTLIGLPVIIYHSITRTKWLKEPQKRSITPDSDDTAQGTEKQVNRDSRTPSPPQPLYTRRGFIKAAVGAGMTLTLGPTFVRWLGQSFKLPSVDEYAEDNANTLLPNPVSLPQSANPIGGGADGHFRVYTVTDIPSFTNANWSFTVDGLVDKKLSWNWEQFVKLQREVRVSDFHCVTGWSVYKNTWEGIPLARLLELAGGPVRLVVPQMYAYKSVKWLNRIELIQGDHVGYWEERGYDIDAWLPDAKRV